MMPFVTVDTFYGCNLHEDDCIIGGRVVDADNIPVPGVLLAVKGSQKYYFTNEFGYYAIHTPSKGETYTITPIKDGYNYSFYPEHAEITVNDNVMVLSFTAEYTGSPLYNIFRTSNKYFSYEKLCDCMTPKVLLLSIQ